MGSSGSGRISDYPTSSRKPGGGAGGDQPQDRCGRAFTVRLQDIEQCDYYRAHKSTPPVGTQVQVALRKRLIAQTTDGDSVGNLPTSLNYLAACIHDGWTYVGTIQSVDGGPPITTIGADFAAIPPK